ncbi:MAG: proline--tRNA ligase [Nanobdellota archaeon]
MAKEKTKGITVKKEEDINEWYSQVILKAGFADYAPVKGCMIIRPLAYSCWENLTRYFDNIIKEKGVKNAYFPLFIPESFFRKEADHAEGFSPEVAWIENKEEGAERLAIRPTSETIMYDSYSKWIRSHRDLPLRLNQWCNVCRWEVQDVKLFLRSREFLWQEGHCVYETEEECQRELLSFLEDYRKVAEDLLAMPVILGEKTPKERFAGAKRTYTIEGFMPDGKALQLGTSHNLGQGFAKAFGIQYSDKDEKKKYPWQNSWGISTRMLGGMVMLHSDNNGLVLPPRVAPEKVVIVPILFDKTREKVMNKAEEIKDALREHNPFLDDRDSYNPGWKFNEWEMKGTPVRIEIGPKDVDNSQAVLVRRDTGEKKPVRIDNIKAEVADMLLHMHNDLFAKAKQKMQENTVEAENFNQFRKAVEERKLIKTKFCCEKDCEENIKDETSATTRCIPLDSEKPEGKCFFCGREASSYVYFSKNY